MIIQKRLMLCFPIDLNQFDRLPEGSSMHIMLLVSAVLVAGILALEGLAQQPLPPTSGVNPVKKGVPGRSGFLRRGPG